ncbi:secreted subtilisin-like serine protease [Phycomyces blakesleeanus]|uniref:Secreted subtilisin-like serine protease n=1 Tax=Phycomyces blakesleeanus TaxID=4837 RepID=A0ABR3B0Y2_PHYBL
MIWKPLVLGFAVLFSLANAAPSHSKAEHYIVKVNDNVVLQDFMPRLLAAALDAVDDLVKKEESRHHRRCLEKHAEIVKTFEMGSFKAFSIEVLDRRVIDALTNKFPEIQMIVPDELIQYDILDVPNHKDSDLQKRYRIRYPRPNYPRQSTDDTDEDHEDNHEEYHRANPRLNRRCHKPAKTVASTNTTSDSLVLSQKNSLWNLARLSVRDRNLNAVYEYEKNAGTGVTVYVVDDGLLITHKDFGGRAKWGWSPTSTYGKEGGGHGTHVAGIIGGTQYGVAKNVSLTAVQVLNRFGQGTVSTMLSGIEFVIKDAKKHKGRALVNMSLGMPTGSNIATLIDEAVGTLIKNNIPVVAAAGNTPVDACNTVPAGTDNVFTVSSIDNNDTMDPYSAYGKCVDVLAPGISIRSTWIGSSNSETALMSGTSMASPHAAGVAALLMTQLGSNPTPAQVYAALKADATLGKVKDLKPKTPNAIVHHTV